METNKRNVQNGNDNGTNAGNQASAKEPLKDRLQKAYLKFKASKAGKWTIRGLKAAGALTVLGATYKAGQRHPENKNAPESEQQKLEEPVVETTPEEAPAAETPAVEEEI